MSELLPFQNYPGEGALQGRRPRGDSAVARRGYAREVLPWCDYRCVYCGLQFDTFESWLLLSAAHVVPRSAAKQVADSKWIEDVANVVACCRSCNDFLNHYEVERTATTERGFVPLRDWVFRDRHARIRTRRDEERAWYRTNVERGLARDVSGGRAGER